MSTSDRNLLEADFCNNVDVEPYGSPEEDC